jgi:hypothetical protein
VPVELLVRQIFSTEIPAKFQQIQYVQSAYISNTWAPTCKRRGCRVLFVFFSSWKPKNTARHAAKGQMDRQCPDKLKWLYLSGGFRQRAVQRCGLFVRRKKIKQQLASLVRWRLKNRLNNEPASWSVGSRECFEHDCQIKLLRCIWSRYKLHLLVIYDCLKLKKQTCRTYEAKIIQPIGSARLIYRWILQSLWPRALSTPVGRLLPSEIPRWPYVQMSYEVTLQKIAWLSSTTSIQLIHL